MNDHRWRRPAIPVLMYHDIGDRSAANATAHYPYVVTADAFSAHMKLLKDSGLFGASLKEVLERDDIAEGGGERPCVITFDDGDESNITRAVPALRDAGFRATFFVTAGWIGRAPYMTWDQVRSLSAAGMEIGSHSMTHRPPASLKRHELFAEMADSKKLLEDRLGHPIQSASSPTGFFNPAIIPVTMEVGYRALCVGRIALWRSHDQRFRIPRLPVKQRTRIGDFRRMVLGERRLIARLRGEQILRDGLKSILGVQGYLGLRRALMRLLRARQSPDSTGG